MRLALLLCALTGCVSFEHEYHVCARDADCLPSQACAPGPGQLARCRTRCRTVADCADDTAACGPDGLCERPCALGVDDCPRGLQCVVLGARVTGVCADTH